MPYGNLLGTAFSKNSTETPTPKPEPEFQFIQKRRREAAVHVFRGLPVHGGEGMIQRRLQDHAACCLYKQDFLQVPDARRTGGEGDQTSQGVPSTDEVHGARNVRDPKLFESTCSVRMEVGLHGKSSLVQV